MDLDLYQQEWAHSVFDGSLPPSPDEERKDRGFLKKQPSQKEKTQSVIRNEHGED
ncbi:MAG: hypothetical protein QXI19_07220 [Candidatus Caldarchaeum sp.]